MAELSNLKKSRAAMQGHLTRHAKRYETHHEHMDFTALQAMLKTIEDMESRFLDVEEKIIILEEKDVEEEGAPEIPPSPAFDRFMDDYDDLRSRIMTLIEQKRPRLDMNTIVNNSGGGPTQPSRTFRLPKLDVPRFSGNVTEWTDFKNEFSSLVNDEALSDVDRFRFLRSALGEVPKRIISSMEVTGPNYKKAWDALVERFDNKSIIYRAHINEFLLLQGVSGEEVGKQRELLDKSRAHYRALTSLGTIENLAENLMICVMLQKLDSKTQAKWEESTDNDIATWDEFTSFLEKYTTTMENVQTSKQQRASKPKQSTSNPGKKLHTTLFSDPKLGVCKKCNASNHELKDCPSFISLSPKKRCDETKRLRLCMKCLSSDHSFRDCQVRCAKCRKGHNFLLHYEVPTSSRTTTGSSHPTAPSHTPPSSIPQGEPQATSTPTSAQTCLADHGHRDTAIVGSVMVDIFDDSGNRFPVHALLDSGSTTHIVSEAVARLVNARIQKGGSLIGGVGATCTKVTGSCQLRMGAQDSDRTYDVHAYTMTRVSGPYPSNPFDISSWDLPSHCKLANPKFNLPQKVDLLIGAGLFWTLLRPGRLLLGPDLPYLQETDLGWIVVGSMTTSPISHKALTAIQSGDDALLEIVQRFWEVDTLPGDFQVRMSVNDQVCEDLFRLTTKRDSTGRYVVHLPFKQEDFSLGRSDQIAKQRFFNLERKLSRDPTLKQMYVDFIDEYEKLGHLERVQDFDYGQPHYFIPHHCVLKPTSSTTKLRVVFDASCKTSNGLSLNDVLLPGPKILDDLFEILLRFRLFRYVVTADVQKMYRQTLIHPEHANFQMIYWRRSETEPLETLRLLTVTYGTTPGAFLAIRALRQLAIDEQQAFPIGSALVLKHFYVDDALFGADSIPELEESLRQLCGLLSAGGLSLGKICSNSDSLMEKIPPERREKFLKVDDHEIIRTLGLLWEPESDTFRYCSETVPIVAEGTKRTVLSNMARIFDPLGLICPVVCLAKTFYQDLWKLKLGWDDELPPEYQEKWRTFCQQLPHLKDISIPRYVLCGPKPESIEIHGFSDASERAYGACVYVRSCDGSGNYTVELACARSKVAPTKTISIARLELCAAKLLVDLVFHLKQKVFNEITIASETYWTDSSITLSWITSEPHRWTTFVAHRVTKIQEATSTSDWHHIPGTDNPADLVSRGMTPFQLATSDLWWHGPAFLRDSSVPWPSEFVASAPLPDLDEARVTRTVLMANNRDDLTSSMRFSVGFRGIRRAFAYALRFIKNARARVIPRSSRIAFLENVNYAKIPIPNVGEELCAEEAFIKSVQQSSFAQEIHDMEYLRPVCKSSPLAHLSPFLHRGLLRVGGRNANANLPFDSRHQILLPGDHPFTNALVFFYHHYRTFHAGAQTTLVAIRTRYWPLRGTILARKVGYNCLWCFRVRPRFVTQLMGNLPEDRVNPKETRAFSITGVDFAGPFVVRHHIRCKQEKKVYLALFICMVSKAVHVELVPDLSTEAFLRALSRFVSDRGAVAKMYSDNGTNFVGAANKLREVQQMLINGQDEISNACRKLHLEWSFTPPRTPHHGGLWEASIKLLKRLMLNIAGNLNLTEDEMRTVAKRATAIINSRPITTVSSDPTDPEPLTPGHFIYGGPATALPELPVAVEDGNINTVHMSRRMAAVNQQLWKRFKKEYLALLQPRTKWLIRNDKFATGTVVLLKDDSTPPLKWPLGTIVKTYPSSDNIIRVVDVKTKQGTFKRGITGVAVLPDNLQSNSLHGGEDVSD